MREEKHITSEQSLVVNQLISDYMNRVDSGEVLTPQQFISAHPESAEELRRYFENVDLLQGLQKPTTATSSDNISDKPPIEAGELTARTVMRGGTDSETSVTSDLQEKSESATRISIPEVFGRYAIQKVLGQGAMGAVYLARDTQLDRDVALKIPKFGELNNVDREEMLARFYREARAAATLRSPNICPVYDVGEIDGQHYITMAYIEGRPLKDFTKSTKQHSEKQIVTTIRKLAIGLEQAHKIGVVHRDLKPANIMVDQHGEPVVMDFGLARRSSSDDVQVTQSGAILGTPAYMSPEQVEGVQSKIGPQADIYALGIIMYELITGEMPYKGSLMSILQQIALNNPKKPSAIRKEIDLRLEKICLKMMAGDLKQRYQSMGEVAADLQDVLRNPGKKGKSKPSQETGPKPTSIPKPHEESNPALISIEQPKSYAEQLREKKGKVHGIAKAKSTGKTPSRSAAKSGSNGPSQNLLIAGGLGGLILLLGIIFLVRVGKFDVQITLDDPSITLSVDGKVLKITEGQNVYKLSAGEHKLQLQKDGLTTHVENFTVTKDGKTALTAIVVNGQLDALLNGEKPPATPVPSAPTGTLGSTNTHPVAGLRFDGSSYVLAPTVTMSPNTPFTMEAVVTLEALKNGEVFGVVGHLGNAGGIQYFTEGTDQGIWSSNVIWGGEQITTGEWEFRPVSDSQFRRVHVAMTWESGKLAFFLEGRLYTETRHFPIHPNSNIMNGLLLGTQGLLDGDVHGGLVGTIHSFKLSRGTIYETDFPPPTVFSADATTEVLYDFSQSNGAVLKDVSGNGHDGKIVGAKWVNPASGAASAPRDPATPTPSEGLRPPLADILTSPDYEWTTPEKLGPEVNSAGHDAFPRVSADGKRMWFQRIDGAWISEREAPGKPWQTANPAPGAFAPIGPMADMFVSRDELTWMFATWSDPQNIRIAEATRTLRHDSWPTPQLLNETVLPAQFPVLTDDGLTLFVMKNFATEAGDEICISTRPDKAAPWSTPIPVSAPLNSTADERPLWISPDQRTLIFHAQREPRTSSRQFDLFFTTRPTLTSPWREPTGFGPGINSEDKEASAWLSDDGQELIFSRERDGQLNDADLYVSRRVRTKQSDQATATGWHGWPADAPAPAIAPFDAEQAQKHQAAWAKHLGVPIMYTNSIGMKFVLIPPGEFVMGSTAEEIAAALKDADEDNHWQECVKSEAPQHKVILTQPIYLGVNEVTQAEYEKVMGVNPSHFAPLGMGKEAVAGLETTNHPVEMVSWNDAAEFCAKLSKQEELKPFYFRAGETITPLDGTGYRLPSEAEREFACRAGTTTKYWIGNKDEDLLRTGWFGGNSGGRTRAAGELKVNPFGLSAIHGNVWEWVQDGWTPNWYGQFQDKPATNPISPLSAGPRRVLRGGDWGSPSSSCRSSSRFALDPTDRSYSFGFRVSLVVDAVREAQTVLSMAGAKRIRTGAVPSSELPLAGNFALEFHGGEDQVVIDGLSLPEQGALTWEAWVSPKDHSDMALMALPLSADQGLFRISIWNRGPAGVRVNKGRNAVAKTSSQTFPAAGAFHLAVTQVNDTWTFWVNGKRVGEGSDRYGWNNPVTQLFPAKIGVDQGVPVDSNQLRAPFRGTLDEVRISKVVRYSTDFTPATRHEPDTDTLALYHFDEGTGDVLKDSSGNGHHGKIIGAKWVKVDSPGATDSVGTNAPPPAVAPFDAVQAKAHQQAWAAYLQVPVEYTNSLGMKFRLIPPGEFMMGSTPEEIEAALKAADPNDLRWQECVKSEAPRHKVILTRPLYLGVNQVTQAEYEKVMGVNPSHFAPTGMGKEAVAGLDTAGHPVEMVSWNDAIEFSVKLSQQETLKPFYFKAGEMLTLQDGTGYRLPSEAEWEYACRAGTTTKCWIGDKEADLLQVGWFAENGMGRTHPVGQMRSSPFGLCDMHGNVWEWTQDSWDESWYGKSANNPAIDPQSPFAADSMRVVRGSHLWVYSYDSRSSARHSVETPRVHGYLGFRVTLTVEAVQQELARRVSTKPVTSNGWHGWPTDAPPPAVAPFDEAQAKAHQQAWADYLGTKVETTNSIGQKLILIPPGEFLMGSSDADIEQITAIVRKLGDSNKQWIPDFAKKNETPQHRVTLTKPYLLSATEVTVAQFRRFVEETKYQTDAERYGFGNSGLTKLDDSRVDPKTKGLNWLNPGYEVADDQPVSQVSPKDADAFCDWLSRKEGAVYGLPTEAEWEFACRAGTTTPNYFGADHSKYAAYAWCITNARGKPQPVGTKLPNPFGLFDMLGNLTEYCADI